MKKKIENIVKTNKILNKLFTLIVSIPFKILGIFIGEKKKTVLFVSFMGKSFNDSPKYIFDKMIGDEYFKGFTFVWAFNDVDKFHYDDPRVKFVKMDSFEYFKTALSSELWITNVNIERGLKFKKKYTKYINTWHGIPLKKIGNDVEGRSDFNFSNIDYFSYSGDFEKEIYKRAFKLNDENMYPNGMPRNDIIIRNESNYREVIKNKYDIKNKKIIMYAPTWRDNEEDLPILDINMWKEILGNEYILFVRSHGLTETLNIDSDDFVVDVSDYSETAELIIAADILITDYSSILFDFSLTEKPIYLLAPDYDKYSETRGVYFNLLDCGLNVYDNDSDLVNDIYNINLEDEKIKVAKFKEMYFYDGDGNATNKIVQFIKERVD